MKKIDATLDFLNLQIPRLRDVGFAIPGCRILSFANSVDLRLQRSSESETFLAQIFDGKKHTRLRASAPKASSVMGDIRNSAASEEVSGDEPYAKVARESEAIARAAAKNKEMRWWRELQTDTRL